MWFACWLYLDVRAGGEPGLMGQHFINVVKETKARGGRFQTVQPQRVPAHPQKLGWMKVHQVVTVMSRCSLKVSGRGSYPDRFTLLPTRKHYQPIHWPRLQCNGGMAGAGGRPCAGCSVVCAGSFPSTEGERPSAGTWRPSSPCWPEPSWTAATLVPSHLSPSPRETSTGQEEGQALMGNS